MKKEQILISTNNQGKLREFKDIFSHLNVDIVSKKDLGIEDFEIVEDGDSLEENSIIKARALKDRVDMMVVADDSGLFVESLDNKPGVHSSRYAGEDGNDDKNNEKLLKELEGKENRKAKFMTVIALIHRNGEVSIARGECKGRIIGSKRGENGFGYDPLFVPEGYDKTFAELGDEVKNKISHRAKALDELIEIVEEIVRED